ncbi:MAG: helix-turn-helix domain-containing protein [Clostridia bacterium]|nr:helix-turn-helix domain-containing protein [Clostridia bacterium]
MRIAYPIGFTQIPNYILRSKVLKPLQKVVLAVLCSYANDENLAFPSYQTIANDSGISRRKAIEIIGDLERLGCIRKIAQKSTKGDNTANDYVVLIGGADFALPGESPALPGEYGAPPCGESPAPRGERRAPNQYIDNNINIYFNNNHQSITAAEMDEMEEQIKENIDYTILKQSYTDGMLEEIVSVMVEATCATATTIRIGDNEFPREVVKAQMLKLGSEHVEYVIDCIKKNTTKVRNIKAYMLRCIYNAPQTIAHYYTAEVNHDLYGG